jgi:uncharacterized repeat protein (TIGR01451 family)
MSSHIACAITAVAVLLPAVQAGAAGTPAGTDITNQATVTYTVDSVVHSQSSNIVTTTVAELLEVNVVWQDAAPVEVNPGALSEVLTFRLTNTGNGTDSYTLSGQSVLPGDDFDPTLGDLYLDADGDGLFNPDADDRYIQGTNDPTLPADGFVIVFVLNGIPGDANPGELGNSELTAGSNTGTGVPGTVIPGGGENGTDAVVGTSGGSSQQTGTYLVVAVPVQVEILKAATVSDPYGGAQPVPGASITYTLNVTASGVGTALGVVVTDALPTHTTYHAGTLLLNGGTLTDIADGDPGDVGDTTPGTVTVNLGDLAVGVPAQIIEFTVTID